MNKIRSKSPSESIGGTRGELVPTREAHREHPVGTTGGELYNFRRNCVRHGEVFGC